MDESGPFAHPAVGRDRAILLQCSTRVYDGELLFCEEMIGVLLLISG